MAIWDKIKTWAVSGFLTNGIRHGLTAIGAWLIAQGLPGDIVLPWQDETIDIVLRLLPILLSLLWSVLEKKALQKMDPIK